MAGAAVTVLALTACGASDSSDHTMPGMGTSSASAGVSASAPTGAATFNDADVMFAQMMIPHHRQAVEMAVLAETRASDAQVKSLAGQIKAAQDPEIAALSTWLAAWGKPITAPSDTHGAAGHASMPGMMSDADMVKLTAASGKDFDRQFCTLMIAHHQGAVTMAAEEIAKGANPEAKKLAEQISTTQQAEITTMTAMLARL